jgi:predicted transcriptional regulator
LNTLTCSYEQEQFEDSVKKNLARSIAQHLIENGLIEFTKVKNTDRFSMTYKARAFLLGKDGVNYIKNNMKVY